MKNLSSSAVALIFFTMYACNILSSNVPATTTTFNDHDSIHIFAALRFPTTQVTDKFTLQIFKEIDATFGASGAKMDPLQIAHIKNTYLYLIFLTKLQKVQTIAAYQAYKSDFATFMQDNNQRTPHLPTTELVQSEGWQNIPVTSQDIIASPLWQMFCKSMICDTYAYFATGLQIIHNVEKQEFNYIPHFETSYYNQDYTNLRTINAIVRAKIELEKKVKQRYLAQCPTWKNLPAQKDSSVSPAPTTNNMTLELAIVLFRKTPFYQLTHDLHSLLGTRATINAGQPITNEQLMSAPELKTPLKEYVFGYFMLYELYGQLTTHMTDDNLDEMLSICSNSKLNPNIFPYTNGDFVLLNELLAAKSKAEGTNVQSLHPSPKTFKPEDFRKPEHMLNPTRTPTTEYLVQKSGAPTPAVQAQSFWDDIGHAFSHLGSDIVHDVKKGWSDVKHGAEAAWKGVKDTAEAVGYGVAGLGCKAIFWDKSLVADGEHLSDESQKKFISAGTDLQNTIDDFADSIKDGIVAPIGELSGDLVGFIVQDKAIGADISQVIDTVSDSIVQATAQFAADTTVGVELYTAQETMDIAEATEDVTTLIVASTEVIFTAGQYGKSQFLNEWHVTMHDTLTAITAAYTNGMQFVKSAIAAVMQALGAVINAITTIFIDLSREITFLFTLAYATVIGGIKDLVTGQKFDPIKVANSAADHVRNTLNAHRAVINQVMGVVICVAADAALDVVTAGAGTPADAEMDVMIMGGAEAADAMAEGSVEAAEEAATTAQDAVSSAQDAVDLATKNLDEATESGDQAAMNAAKQDLENAQKDLEENIEKAKTAAENAVKAQQKAALRYVADNVKDEAKTFSQKVMRYGKEKVENALDSIKSFPKNMAKSLTNLMKSNTDLAEEAGEESDAAAQTLAKAKDAFNAAKEKLMNSVGTSEESTAKEAFINAAKDLKEAQTEAKEAEEAAKSAESIAKETKGQKALRLLKGSFKVFKPMGFIMNVAFNFTTMISGYNQDEENLLQQEQQAKALQDLWQANTQSKLSTAQTDLAYLQEMSEKQYAAVGNQALGLALYQNYSYSFINEYQQSILSALAPTYIMQLLPDNKTGLVPGNTGTLWGLTSNYLDLYPSQGFYSTTTGRADFPFAQEIAQTPRLLTQQAGSSVSDKQWFNQRCIAVDTYAAGNKITKKANDPLSVKIDLQFLYTLQSEFHVGIYMGGDYHNYFSNNYLAQLLNQPTPATIQSAFANLQNALSQTPQLPTTPYLNPNAIDLNEPYLAKMLILYRNSANDPIKIGVYEHMGAQEWLLQQALPATADLSASHTYTLQATLNGDSLNIALFVDNNTTPTIQQMLKVTPIANQRMYGIISSGAAIQWNQITPQPVIAVSKIARPATTATPEIQRAKQMKVALADAQSPSFGTITLTPLSKQSILFNQYLYASTKTDMAKIDPKNPADFLVFGTNTNGTITNIGKIPNSITDKATNVLISLITGHVFNITGEIIKIIPDVWTNYKTSQYGPFSANLDSYITTQQKIIATALSKIKFGSFNLNIIDQASLQAGTYIYTCAQTLKDSSGKPMLDYLIFTQKPTSTATQLQLGLPPTSPHAQAILSLVSGNIYLKDTQLLPNTTPTATYSFPVATEFMAYNKQNNIQQTDYDTITAAQTTYIAQQAASNTPSAPKIAIGGHIGSIQTIDQQQIAQREPAIASKSSIFAGFKFHPKLNIANRRNQAAGSTPFQFHAPKRTPA